MYTVYRTRHVRNDERSRYTRVANLREFSHLVKSYIMYKTLHITLSVQLVLV